MAGLATIAKVRQVGNLPGVNILADDRISAFFLISEYRLRKWIGDTAYDAAVAALDADPTKIRLVEAESFLVCHFGVRVSWNMAVTSQGMMQSKALGGEGGTITLVDKSEREAMAANFLEMASMCAEPFFVGGTGEGAFEFMISRADYEDDEA